MCFDLLLLGIPLKSFWHFIFSLSLVWFRIQQSSSREGWEELITPSLLSFGIALYCWCVHTRQEEWGSLRFFFFSYVFFCSTVSEVMLYLNPRTHTCSISLIGNFQLSLFSSIYSRFKFLGPVPLLSPTSNTCLELEVVGQKIIFPDHLDSCYKLLDL